VVVGVLSYVVSIVEGDIDATGILLTDSPDPVFLGNDLTYDPDVSNSGQGSVTDVNLIVTLPCSVAFALAIGDFEASSSARLGTTAVFASSPKVAQPLSNLDAPLFAIVDECTEGSGTVICSLGTLESGQMVRVTIKVEPEAAGILNNQAKLVQEGADAEAPSTTADESTTVLLMSDLSISLRDVSPAVFPGDEFTINFSVSNSGPSAATGTFVTGTLPDGVRLISPSDCTITGRTIKCYSGGLDSGESRILSIRLVLDPGAKGELVNTFSVSGEQSDSNSEGNSITAKISITEIAELALEREDKVGPLTGVPPVNEGEIISEFTVTNNGPSNATNIVLTNELSMDVDVVSVTGDQADCSANGGTLVCSLSDLAKGETTSFAIVLFPKEEDDLSGRASVRSDQSNPEFGDLESAQFFLERGENDTQNRGEPELLFPNLGLDPDSSRDSSFWIGGILLGSALGGLFLFLGKSFIFGGKRRARSVD
jgi:uncharacterized repeat protein (TIGR01451 family)